MLHTEVITEYGRSRKHRHTLDRPTVALRGRLTGSGCAILEASTAIMAELIEGRTVDEVLDLLRLFVGMIQKIVTDEAKLERLEDALALRGIANIPIWVKCAILPWLTLDEALKKLEAGLDRE